MKFNKSLSLLHPFHVLMSCGDCLVYTFSISVELAKKVRPVRSLRPVLESLFHRFLLCPAPQNRHDAIKVVKEVGIEVCEVIKTSVRISFP